MPTLKEILPTLTKAKLFTVLEAKDGFHQVKLDDASSYLTTFWTPFGLYRYLHMLFGISSEPEEFHTYAHNSSKSFWSRRHCVQYTGLWMW